jgi:hypothetical protein
VDARSRSGSPPMVVVMGKYLDLIREAEGCAKSAESAVSPQLTVRVDSAAALRSPFSRLSRLSRTLSALESRCPEHVPVARWQQCVDDGRTFLARWGHQAFDLGWTARDLFGLFPVPENPHPSFARLSRYDHTGLIWLLAGRLVIALTEATAAIQNPTGCSITVYRRRP